MLTMLSIIGVGIAIVLGAHRLAVRPLLFPAEVPLFDALAWSLNYPFHNVATLAVLAATIFLVLVVQGSLG